MSWIGSYKGPGILVPFIKKHGMQNQQAFFIRKTDEDLEKEYFEEELRRSRSASPEDLLEIDDDGEVEQQNKRWSAPDKILDTFLVEAQQRVCQGGFVMAPQTLNLKEQRDMLEGIWEAALSCEVYFDLLAVNIARQAAEQFFESRCGVADVIIISEYDQDEETETGLVSLWINNDPTKGHQAPEGALSEIMVDNVRVALAAILNDRRDIYDRRTEDIDINLPEGRYKKAADIQITYVDLPEQLQPPVTVEVAHRNSKERKHIQVMEESRASVRGSAAKVAFGLKIQTSQGRGQRYTDPILSLHGLTTSSNSNKLVFLPTIDFGFMSGCTHPGMQQYRITVKSRTFLEGSPHANHANVDIVTDLYDVRQLICKRLRGSQTLLAGDAAAHQRWLNQIQEDEREFLQKPNVFALSSLSAREKGFNYASFG